jgi:hypothetical protein
VFLIQRSQNKESLAIQLKLNELVAALQGASNRLIDVEGLTEDELQLLRKHYRTLANLAAHDFELGKSHSVEEAEHRHRMKRTQHIDATKREKSGVLGCWGSGVLVPGWSRRAFVRRTSTPEPEHPRTGLLQ